MAERAPWTDTTPSRAHSHIVFVSLVFHPDTSASSILFTDLFERFAAMGTRVTILCGFPSKDTLAEVGHVRRVETHRGVTIIRCGLRVQGKRSLGTRALAYGSFLLHASWRLLWMDRDATVVGGTDPPFTPIALRFSSLLGRFRYDVMLLDVYPDGLVALGSMRGSSALVRLWRSLNRRSFLGARRVIVIGRDMADLLERRYRIPRDRIAYVPHWATTEIDEMDAGSRAPLLEELELSNKFVVQYSGNMGLWHDIDAIVHTADRLRSRPDIHFLLIGKGMRRGQAEALSRRLELTNLTWLDFQPRSRLASTLAGCDAALISMREGLEGVAVPSKLYGILASGRPILAHVPTTSEVARVVEEEECGIVIAPGDVEGLAAAIGVLAADSEATLDMGGRARRAYVAKYTLTSAITAFSTLWESTEGL